MYYRGTNYASPVMRVKRPNTTGTIHCQRKKTNISTKKKEYRSKKARNGDKLLGKSAKSILEPSRGGTGTRLKTAKTILIMTIVTMRLPISGES